MRNPPEPWGTGTPSLSTIAATTPGSGNVAEPGLVGVAPGRGDIMIMPVSVCHQVSTIGHVLWPMCSRYHIQALGLIGSPTEPSRRRLFIGCFAGHSVPMRINARIAVG